MVGIQHTADIKLTVTLDKKGLADLRKAMKTITTGLKTQKAAKDMKLLTNQIERLKKDLRDAKKEVRDFKKATDEQSKASQKSKKDTSAQAQAVARLRKEQRAATQSTNASRQAEAALTSLMRGRSKAVQTYVAQMRQRIGAERTLAVMRRQALNAERAALAASKQTVGRTKEQIAAIQKLRAERRQGAAQTKQSIAAEVKLNTLMRTKSTTTRAYIAAMMQRIGAERTLAIVQKQAEAAEKRRAVAAKSATVATKRVRIEIKGAAGDLQRYHMGLVRSANAQNKFGQSLRQARTFVGRFSTALSEAEGRMDALFRASFRMTIVGFTLQRFAQNIMRWGSSIMDVFEEFEFTLGRAAGALEVWKGEMWDGKDATQVMTDSVLGLAKQMKVFTAEEVAKGLYFWGSATGQTAESVEDLGVALSGLDKIMKAAFMTNTDYEGTIKGVYSILTQFYSGDLSQAGDVTEKLFLSTQKTAAEWNDLIQSFKMVGPVAAQAGASFDQVNEAFGKLSDLGLRGSQAGRGLRQFFIQLVRPSGPAQKKWSELFEDNEFRDGKTMRETLFPEGEFIGITEAIQEIDLATQHLNATDRLTALARVTTANSLPLLTALMAQERNERLGLAEANTKLEDSDPSEYFRENWERLSTTWKAARGSYERVVESLKIQLGVNIASALEPLIENLNKMVEQVELFVKLNPGLVKMVAQFAALAAAGSMALGTIFIISGALVGLFAAFHLVFDAIGKWAGQVMRAIGVIGLFGVAIVDNINILIEKGVTVVENLTSAFGDMDDAASDVIGIIEELTAPVKEFMGYLVRFAADIAIVISEIIKFAAAVDGLAGGAGWDAIIMALKVIVSTRIISGILGVTTALVGLRNVTVSLAATGAMHQVQLWLRFISSRGIIAAVAMLTKRLQGLLVAMGPIGWAALGASLLLTADQLPIVGDFVRGLTADWKNLNKELKDTVGYFGEDFAWQLEELALEFSPDNVKLPAARQVLAPWAEELNQFMTNHVPVDFQLPLLKADSGPDAVRDFIAAIDLNSSTWQGDEEIYNAFNEAAKMARDGASLVEDVYYDINEDAGRYADEWKATHLDLSKAIITSGRGFKVSVEEYAGMLKSFSSIVQAGINPSSHASVDAGAVLDDITRSLLLSAPDKLSHDEFMPWLDSFNETWAWALSEAVSPTKALAALGDRVGKESTIVNKEVAAYIEKAMSEVDPYELRELVHAKLDMLGGKSIFELMGNDKEFGDIQPLLQALMSQYDTAIASLEEGGASLGMDVIEARLKNALETMQVNMLKNAMPDLADISSDIEQYAIDNTDASYQELAQTFLNAFADGQSLAEMVLSGDFEGTSISTLKSIAEALVKAGYGGEALRKFVAESAEDDGEEAGKSLREGWLEGLAGVKEITLKDIKEAMKLGPVGKRLAQASAALTKSRAYASTHNLNPEARDALRTQTQNVGAGYRKTSRAQKRQGKLRASRATTGEGVATQLAGYGKLSEGQQTTATTEIVKLAKVNPSAARKVVKASNVGKQYKKAILAELKENAPTQTEIKEALGIATPKSGPNTGYAPEVSVIPTPDSGPNVGLAPKKYPSAAQTKGVGKGQGELPKVPKPRNPFAAIRKAKFPKKAVQTTVDTGMAQVWTDMAAAPAVVTATEKSAEAVSTATATAVQIELSSEVNAGFISSGMVDAFGLGADLAALSVGEQAKPVAVAAVTAFAEQIRSATSIAQVNSAIQVLFAALKGESPPRTGPLKHIDKWGENIGTAWSEGVSKGVDAGEQRIMDANTFSNIEVVSKGKKEIVIKLEVTSPDGSVNRQKQGEMRRGAMEALIAADLEHAVTVG